MYGASGHPAIAVDSGWRTGASTEEDRTMLHALATRENSLSTFETNKRRLLEIIKEKSLLRGGSFKLASGAVSDYYLDMKPTTFDPEGSFLISEIVFAMLQGDREIDSIGGIELGAIPIVMAITGRSWPARPLTGFVVRKEKKGHGTDKHIDGNFKPSTNVVLFDDVTTLGGSVIKAIHAVREHGSTVKRVITVVDRLEGASDNLQREGLNLEAIFTTSDLLST
jgi:orotate phosphoribosyltransferase